MKTCTKGFTRPELVFVLLGLTLVALPAVSLLAGNKTDSQRAVCFNNLRQIGRGAQMWASDHADLFPWRFPVSIDGGVINQNLSAAAWYRFDILSNHLDSPKILVCPADSETPRIADNWTSAPGGLLNAAYRNAALSYFIGLHAQPYNGQSILSGDRNIRASGISSCSLLPGGAACPQLSPFDSNVKWTNAIHGLAGHLLFVDGSVRISNSSDLQRAIREDGDDDNGSGVHLLGK